MWHYNCLCTLKGESNYFPNNDRCLFVCYFVCLWLFVCNFIIKFTWKRQSYHRKTSRIQNLDHAINFWPNCATNLHHWAKTAYNCVSARSEQRERGVVCRASHCYLSQSASVLARVANYQLVFSQIKRKRQSNPTPTRVRVSTPPWGLQINR